MAALQHAAVLTGLSTFLKEGNRGLETARCVTPLIFCVCSCANLGASLCKDVVRLCPCIMQAVGVVCAALKGEKIDLAFSLAPR
jgi:hypothetical protein